MTEDSLVGVGWPEASRLLLGFPPDVWVFVAGVSALVKDLGSILRNRMKAASLLDADDRVRGRLRTLFSWVIQRRVVQAECVGVTTAKNWIGPLGVSCWDQFRGRGHIIG
jgi:hypothetical protein